VRGECERCLLLADARRPVKEVRVHRPFLDSGLEQSLRRVLLDDLVKHRAPP
jgi:hypothetical protein